MKKSLEYNSGKVIRQQFERTMSALFRVPKATAKTPEKPVIKEQKEGGK